MVCTKSACPRPVGTYTRRTRPALGGARGGGRAACLGRSPGGPPLARHDCGARPRVPGQEVVKTPWFAGTNAGVDLGCAHRLQVGLPRRAVTAAAILLKFARRPGNMLAATDVAVLGQLAARRPTARIHLAPRGERLQDPQLRAAYALKGLEAATAHVQACHRCGQCTASWREACEPDVALGRAPAAICTACDADRLVCFSCMAKGRSWEAARAAYQRLHPEEFVAGAANFRVTAVAAPDGTVGRVARRG